MLATDPAWLLTISLGIIFLLLGFIFPQSRSSREQFNMGYGEIINLFRPFVFIPISAVCFGVAGYLGFTINNCDAATSICYSDPNYLTVTATVYASPFDVLGWVFFSMALIEIVVIIIIGVYILPILVDSLRGKPNSTPGDEMRDRLKLPARKQNRGNYG